MSDPNTVSRRDFYITHFAVLFALGTAIIGGAVVWGKTTESIANLQRDADRMERTLTLLSTRQEGIRDQQQKNAETLHRILGSLNRQEGRVQ